MPTLPNKKTTPPQKPTANEALAQRRQAIKVLQLFSNVTYCLSTVTANPTTASFLSENAMDVNASHPHIKTQGNIYIGAIFLLLAGATTHILSKAIGAHDTKAPSTYLGYLGAASFIVASGLALHHHFGEGVNMYETPKDDSICYLAFILAGYTFFNIDASINVAKSCKSGNPTSSEKIIGLLGVSFGTLLIGFLLAKTALGEGEQLHGVSDLHGTSDIIGAGLCVISSLFYLMSLGFEIKKSSELCTKKPKLHPEINEVFTGSDDAPLEEKPAHDNKKQTIDMMDVIDLEKGEEGISENTDPNLPASKHEEKTTPRNQSKL